MYAGNENTKNSLQSMTKVARKIVSMNHSLYDEKYENNCSKGTTVPTYLTELLILLFIVNYKMVNSAIDIDFQLEVWHVIFDSRLFMCVYPNGV